MKYILSMVLLITCNLLISQNQLEGTVTDASTKQPIAFANVYLPQLEKGSITDENGHFVINNLPNGNYKIVYSLLGYETAATTIQLPLTDSLNLSLMPSVVEMEEIIVSTPFHKLQSENVMKVEQAKISELKANGAVTLSDGITDIAGVSSITTGQGIGKPVIRGLSSNRVLVYTQGVRLENQQFGDEHGLGLSDDGIESVEVIKGPASLLYGSDALGGVLYINPERFANANESATSGSFSYYTNTQGINTDLGYKSSGEKFKFLFRGGLESYSDYDTKDYRVTNTRFRSQDFKAGLGYQSTHFKTELRYNVNGSKLGIPEELGKQSTDKNPLLPYQELLNHVFSSKSTLFFDKSSLDVNLGYVYNDRKEFEEEHEHGEEEDDHEEEEHEILDPALHMKLKTFNYDVKYNLPTMGKFETILGVQGMFQENSNYGEEELIPDANVTDFGALAVSHIHFEKVDVQLGLRYDIRMLETANLDKDFSSFNAAIGGKTNLTDNLNLRLNIASGFRAPNLAELTSYGSHEGTGRFEIGNPNLKNEQNVQFDVALEYKNEHIEIFANGFYNLVNNYIYIEPNGEMMDEDPVFLYVQNDAKLYGGEAGFHLHPHPLDWLHFESSFETVYGEQNSSDLPLIPATNLNNTLRVEFANRWLSQGYAFTKLSTTFKQDKVSYFETPTDGYSLLSAGLGGTFNWKDTKISVNLTSANLLDKTYVSHLSRLKPDGIYNIGRNFSVGINVQI